MEILNNPSRDTWDALTERNIPNDAAIEESVREIVPLLKRRAMKHCALMPGNLTGQRLRRLKSARRNVKRPLQRWRKT